jgi:hypothetical protein
MSKFGVRDSNIERRIFGCEIKRVVRARCPSAASTMDQDLTNSMSQHPKHVSKHPLKVRVVVMDVATAGRAT